MKTQGEQVDCMARSGLYRSRPASITSYTNELNIIKLDFFLKKVPCLILKISVDTPNPLRKLLPTPVTVLMRFIRYGSSEGNSAAWIMNVSNVQSTASVASSPLSVTMMWEHRHDDWHAAFISTIDWIHAVSDLRWDGRSDSSFCHTDSGFAGRGVWVVTLGPTPTCGTRDICPNPLSVIGLEVTTEAHVQCSLKAT